MAQALRKVRLKNASASDKPGRFTISLSGAALAALSLVLIAAVGWSFFMGFMVGRGQNPEKRVGQMTGMLQEEQGLGDALPQSGAPAGPASGLSPVQPVAPLAPGTQPSAGDRQEAEITAAAPLDPVNPAAGKGAVQTADAQSAPHAPAAGLQSASPAYPFSRPQGEGLAAWGINGNTAGAASPAPTLQAQGDAQGRPATTQAARISQVPQVSQVSQQKAPLFDWLFQAAAFKDKTDADKLRAQLEGRGLRSRQQKSGKVLLVMVSLRGTDLDAANLREELRRMKLGAPILAAKKPVSGTSRKGR